MTMRSLRWGRVAGGLLLGFVLTAPGGEALAQRTPKFVGDTICGACHTGKYTSYKQHGHPWMSVHTGGLTPDPNLFSSVVTAEGEHMPLPALPMDATGNPTVSWSQVQDIVANFKEVLKPTSGPGAGTAFGSGSVLLTTGELKETSLKTNADGTTSLSFGSVNPMPARCNNCHNTGFTFPPGLSADHPPAAGSGIQGSWALSGIQCEQCHGAGQMNLPSGTTGNALCRDCHSSGDGLPSSRTTAAIAAGLTANQSYRIPFNPANGNLTFGNHHPQGDEYRRSPHKNNGCYSCHDPHKSVWHDQGGVLFTPTGADPGDMCIQCHNEQVLIPAMKGFHCGDCHMPMISAGGTRAAHLFRINGTPLAAADNVTPTTGNGAEVSDSNKPTSYWKNSDGTTNKDGDSFLTLDMVCSGCHDGTNARLKTLPQLSIDAPTIHRLLGLDLMANGQHSSLTVKKTAAVAVNFSVVVTGTPDLGKTADLYIAMQGSRGTSYWNGKMWVTTKTAFSKGKPLADVLVTNVFTGKLSASPMPYTFTFSANVANGPPLSSSSVAVTVTN